MLTSVNLRIFVGATDEQIAQHILATGSHAWHPVATAAIGKVVDEQVCLFSYLQEKRTKKKKKKEKKSKIF